LLNNLIDLKWIKNLIYENYSLRNKEFILIKGFKKSEK